VRIAPSVALYAVRNRNRIAAATESQRIAQLQDFLPTSYRLAVPNRAPIRRSAVHERMLRCIINELCIID
jgi:hypothetical protein